METDTLGLLSMLTENPQAAALVPLALVVGNVVKRSKVPDRFIPVTVGAVTGALALVFLGVSVESAVVGIIAGAASVGGYTAVKQLADKSK